MQEKFTVRGMTCSACSLGIERALSKLNGVRYASVSLMLKELIVEFDEKIVSKEIIVATVEKLGYSIKKDGEKEDRFLEAKKLKTRFLVSLFFLVPLMYFSMGVMFGAPAFSKTVNFILQWIFATVIIAINFKFYINGVKAVFALAPNMDTLVCLGSFSAYLYSVIVSITLFSGGSVGHAFFEASAMVLTLVTIGKWLEELSKVKTGDEIEKLNKLIPKTVTVIKDGKMQTVLTKEIEVGDTVVLRVGDYVGVDGVVVEGTATIDKSALTGESLPEEIGVDDFISSGSVVKNGFLLVEAIQVGEDTLFSKIVEIVKTAGTSKAPVQKLADKVSAVFVPIVTVLAIITFVVWYVISKNLYTSLSFGISVLVISCPCSLGLATPVAVMATSGVGAREGILFKEASIMQNACKIDCVLLDKTATITVGKPKVIEYKNLSNTADDDILNLVGSMEEKSSHPLADAVKEFCKKSNAVIDDYEYFAGQGIKATINGRVYYLGNRELLPNVSCIDEKYSESEFMGKTVIYFANENDLLALFVVADYLKEDSFTAINDMKKANLKTVMITGDNYSVAKVIAEQVGIDEFEAQVLPQDKFEIVEKYRKQGYFVAMVGDGINDSPSLKSADVGIAMGTGTDIAIDSSDIIIANGSLKGVVKAIELSKKSLRIIKQNLFWAFLYNVIAIPIASGVFAFANITLTPIIASCCMSLSSLFVVTNALRIRRKRKPKKVSKKAVIGKKHLYSVVIDGMSCGHCSAKVETLLKQLESVNTATVNLQNKTATVESNSTIAEEVFYEVINGAGYKVVSISGN